MDRTPLDPADQAGFPGEEMPMIGTEEELDEVEQEYAALPAIDNPGDRVATGPHLTSRLEPTALLETDLMTLLPEKTR